MPEVSVSDVVLFYAIGDGDDSDYTLDYLKNEVEPGTRDFHNKGGVTHIVPRHPWDPTATDADTDAWLEGRSRGRATNTRAMPIPCEMLGIDPSSVARTHLLDVGGKPAVPGWVGDVKADQEFFDEIKSGVRPNFSAGFRRKDSPSAKKWGLDKPYCDHFAAFGHIGAHCPPLSKQRLQFHELATGAGSFHWFSEELHTMTDKATLATLAKGLDKATLRAQLKEALKLDIFEEIASEEIGDDDGEGGAMTVAQLQKGIEGLKATELAEFSSWFMTFQSSLMGAGGETFSEAELKAMPPKAAEAIRRQAKENAERDTRLRVLEGDKRSRTGDEFAERVISSTPLKGIPALHEPFKVIARECAKTGTRDQFSEKDSLIAKSLVVIAENLPTFEGTNVPTGQAGKRDTFDEKAIGAKFDQDAKDHGWHVTPSMRERHIARARQKANAQ